MKARAAAVIIHDGQILLVERHKAAEHYYTLAGGGIEAGESPEQAVARELMEELGVAVATARRREIVDAGRMVHLFDVELAPDASPVWQELDSVTPLNTYQVVWLALDELATIDLRPHEVKAALIGRPKP